MDIYTFDGKRHVSQDGTIYVSIPKHSKAIHYLSVALFDLCGQHLKWEEMEDGEYIAYLNKEKCFVRGDEKQIEYFIGKDIYTCPRETSEELVKCL